ncbi:hypothetical protein FACS1894163_05030 [Spirochaetia bacterium]|nr:hypothetical protein FACS1894163_05030 [Spirochaetia bacterium]
MKLLFIHDHSFFKEGDIIYSGGGLPAAVWTNNYLPYFDNMTVIGRDGNSKNKKAAKVISSIDRVVFKLIGEYSSIKNYFLYYYKIKRKIEEEILKTDITVVRLHSVLGFMAISILHKYQKPYFVEVIASARESLWMHGSIKGKLTACYFDQLMKKNIKMAPYVVYISNKVRNEYPSDGYSEVISDVILPQILHPKELLLNRFNSKVIKIGLIGSFAARYKGQDILLKAISELNDNIKSNIELYFWGSGEFNWLTKLAIKLNLGTNIRYIGSMLHEELFNMLMDLSLYVQPSYTESGPRAILEAMSMGCPALGSTVGFIPEVISYEYLHQPGDYKKLSKQIKIFYENRELLEKEAFRNLEAAKLFLKDNLDKKRKEFYIKLKNGYSQLIV